MGIYRRSPICRRFTFCRGLNAGLEHISLAHSSFLVGRRLSRENCRQRVLVNSLPAVSWRHSNCLREEMAMIYSFRRFANLGALNEPPIHHHKMQATGLSKCAVLPRALCRQKGPEESQQSSGHNRPHWKAISSAFVVLTPKTQASRDY